MWVVVVAATGCSSAAPPALAPPVVIDAAPAPADAMTPAAAALAANRDALRTVPGVVDVRLDATGAGLVVDVCKRDALGLDLAPLGVPATTALVEATVDASGAGCGCTSGGAYYEVGQSFAADCNSCKCNAGGVAMCTLMNCDVAITEHVFFASGSSKLRPQDEDLLKAVADVLRNHPELAVRLVGHTDAKEKRADKLSQARAEAVRTRLLALGIPASQVTEAVGVGYQRPLGTDAARERYVSFELATP